MGLDKTSQLKIAVHLRPATPIPVPVPGAQPLTTDEYAAAHGADEADLQSIRDFATTHHLTIVSEDQPSRTVVVSGTISQLEQAFKTSVVSDGEGHHFNTRAAFKPIGADAVLGFDTRKIAEAHFRRHSPESAAAHAATGQRPLSASEVASLYGFPKGVTGPDQIIAIIELGGGYQDADNAAAAAKRNYPVPHVTAMSADGTPNSPGDAADGEVALDIQVIAEAESYSTDRPSQIQVWFAQNTDSGFIGAVKAAAHAPGVSAVSISWGGPETNWSSQARQQMDQVIQGAALMGIAVTVASGDNGSTDGTGANVADYPASSPYAIGVGGTALTTSGEVVWGDLAQGGGATGGGPSQIQPRPDYQAGIPILGNWRGVPDVASNAAPSTGFPIFTDGQEGITGGTSAGAPLWAAAIAVINRALGKNQVFLQPSLYKHPECFTDITSGNNGGFSAGPGYDLCTGLGSPKLNKIIAMLGGAVARPPVNPPPVNPPPVNPPPATGMTAAQFQANVRASLRKGFAADVQHENRIERWYNGHFALLADNIVAAEPTS
jgi:kumamolisin